MKAEMQQICLSSQPMQLQKERGLTLGSKSQLYKGPRLLI